MRAHRASAQRLCKLVKLEVLCWSCPAGGADLEATGEELQSCAELSAVEQALQGSQALESHLTLLKSQ